VSRLSESALTYVGSDMAEVDLNVICKHCGAEVSPYITECPYCGQRLRKRAPKLKPEGDEIAVAEPRARRLRRPRRRREDRALSWLAAERPHATIALVLAPAVVYLVARASSLTLFDLGAIFGPLDGDWWRLVAAQFVYENVGYLLAVAVAVAIFGTSLERRYGPIVTLLAFVAAGAAGMYLETVVSDVPEALGGNGAALGLLCAWLVRDLLARRKGEDTETDILGAAAVAVVLALMPLLEPTSSAWAGLGGAVTGALLGLVLPARE
jgi:membrane associated rhomboid family serine protease/ribosomal protein L40E